MNKGNYPEILDESKIVCKVVDCIYNEGKKCRRTDVEMIYKNYDAICSNYSTL